ncbi:MAG: hypothetical protein IPO30_15685 [Hyphomonadaceae bacterium]|nr:hypothetical protein [Hyphomonadaceae bacterium]
MAQPETCSADGPIHLVVVATGFFTHTNLQPEKTWRSRQRRALSDAFAVNAIGPALIGKYALPLLSKSDRSLFAALSARRQVDLGQPPRRMARVSRLEGRSQHADPEPCHRTWPGKSELLAWRCAGTVDTALSAPFRDGTRASKLFTPDVAAGHLLSVIDSLTPEHSGRLFSWDGAEIMF